MWQKWTVFDSIDNQHDDFFNVLQKRRLEERNQSESSEGFYVQLASFEDLTEALLLFSVCKSK